MPVKLVFVMALYCGRPELSCTMPTQYSKRNSCGLFETESNLREHCCNPHINDGLIWVGGLCQHLEKHASRQHSQFHMRSTIVLSTRWIICVRTNSLLTGFRRMVAICAAMMVMQKTRTCAPQGTPHFPPSKSRVSSTE